RAAPGRAHTWRRGGDPFPAVLVRPPARHDRDFNTLLIRANLVGVTVSFTLNGVPVEVGDHPHLLAALREELDVTSPKDGCSPSGQWGCCTVLLGGKPVGRCN